jgi:hypothetical protein
MATPYGSSSVNYDSKRAQYGVLQSGKWQRHLPVNAISDNDVVNFHIRPQDTYIDMRESYMHLKVKVLKSDGTTALPAEARTAFADNIAHTIFKQCVLHLNNEKITHSTTYQAYKNYFLQRFGMSESTRRIHMQQLQGITGEAAGKNDSKNGEARGWTVRQSMTADSAELELFAPIPSDFFATCDKYIPAGVDVRLDFRMNSANFALVTASDQDLGGDAGTLGPCTFKVLNMEIHTWDVEVASAQTVHNLTLRKSKPWQLNYTSLEVQSFTIPAKQKVEYIRNIFNQLPKQIFIVLVETDRCNGVQSKDPFLFSHGGVQKMVLKRQGETMMVNQQTSNFTRAHASKEVYFYLCQSLNVGAASGRDAGLTYDQFEKGSTIWSWNFAPDMDATNGVARMIEPSNLELEIHVDPEVDNPGLTVLMLGKFFRTVLIDDHGVVTLV